MLSLLSLLQVRRDWPGGVLAERLGVTPRTVRRDVDRLRSLGYHVTSTPGPVGGYRLEAGSDLPPLLFDDDQAVAVAVALRDAASTGVDVEEAAERALASVRQVMPSHLRHRVDGIAFTRTAAGPRVDPAVLSAVSEAVRVRTTLRLDHGDAEGPPRRVEPHGLVARHGRWYLVAWDLDRDDWRTFRLDRVRPRTPTGPRFVPREVPTGSAAGFVEARSRGSDEPDRWPCTGTVEVAGSAEEVSTWFEAGSVVPVDDRTCSVEVGSWSWAGVLALVMRLGVPFRVVGPPELAAAARTGADLLRLAADPAPD